MTEAGERLIRSAKQAQKIARMTPDIREKAERLARKFLLGHNQEYLLGTDWHNDLTSAISQALLEAHNAGREEMREEAAITAEMHDIQGVVATAIRSIK